MKIFGIEIFKRNDSSEKIKIIESILVKYSQNELFNIFFKTFEKNKEKSFCEYQLNNDRNFKYQNLHNDLVYFFNYFETFKINEYYLSKIMIKDFIWGETYIEPEHLYKKYNFKYIKIGLYNENDLCVRYNGLKIYEENLIGVDDDYEENLNNIVEDNIFYNLIFEILYSKYDTYELSEFKKKILEELSY